MENADINGFQYHAAGSTRETHRVRQLTAVFVENQRRVVVAAGTSEHVEIDWPIDDYRAGAQELVLEASQSGFRIL